MAITGMLKVPGHLEGGADFMIVTIPPRLRSFCEGFQDSLSKSKRTALARMLSGYLLTGGKRCQSAIGREVLTERRSPSSISRQMRRESFRTRDLVRSEMTRQLIREIERTKGREETWFLAFDGVCLKRGSETKVENAIKYKKKQRGNKGRSTKAHTFVTGILINASGLRIPLPRRSYYTKGYVRHQNKRLRQGERPGNPLAFKTQVDLACLIVKELHLPKNIRLVVVADEYFEGRKVAELCRRKGYIFIAPVSSSRIFESGGKLHARGKSLPRGIYQELILRRGEEDTASHRRHLPRGAGEKDRRVYRFHAEERDVAGIGDVGVVYSWKRKRKRSGRITSRETFKVLACSDPMIPGATIIEWFEMRWPVEVFFRELKSDLGLEDYQGTDFSACERHFDLVMLSFMFLEEMRCQEMNRTRSPVRRREFSCLRTSGFKRHLEQEAHAVGASWISELVASEKESRLVKQLLPEVRLPA
jgi:hypothetical protein